MLKVMGSRKHFEGSLEVNTIRSRMHHICPVGTGTCVGCGKAFHDGGRKKCLGIQPDLLQMRQNGGKTNVFHTCLLEIIPSHTFFQN